MSSSAPNSAQPTSAGAGASNSLSNVLGGIGASTTDTASSTAPASSASSASSASVSSQASSNSVSSAASSASSAAGSNTITNAPSLTSGESSSVGSLTGAPSLTSGNLPKLSDLPTLSGYYSYPPPSVPPTAGAPYMQRNNLPENFVFIIVGACIAFLALVIIAWRTLTAWSMNRRFKGGDGIAGNRSYTPLTDFKAKPTKQNVPSAGHDMKDLGSLPRNFSTVPSLFFSPTAEVAKQSKRPPSTMDMPYGHLPAGHYRDASRT